MLKALPKDYDFALVFDHGFERVDRIANLKVDAAADGLSGDLEAIGGIATTTDPHVADWLRAQSEKPDSDLGREIPHDELVRYAPGFASVMAAFEPVDHVMFGREETGPAHTPPHEKGNHGFWPLRHDYRSIFLLYGPGVAKERFPRWTSVPKRGWRPFWGLIAAAKIAILPALVWRKACGVRSPWASRQSD